LPRPDLPDGSGFYAIDLVARWIGRRVRFIVRAKRTKIRYDVLRTMGRAARPGRCASTEDADGAAGTPGAQGFVRWCDWFGRRWATGEEMILVKRECWSERRISNGKVSSTLANRTISLLFKRDLGLAHLYSFQQMAWPFWRKWPCCSGAALLTGRGSQAGLTVDRLARGTETAAAGLAECRAGGDATP